MTGSARKSLPLHDAAVAVARVLLDAGFESYFAGGCVRDRLLGGVPDDYDIATAARPDDVRRLFPRAHGVGESFGVMLVRHGGHEFEIATFRHDGTYADGRRPSDVRFSDAREDAFRRDFTVNGLFEEPLTGTLVDFVGGESDLKARIVRAIGDPHARFAEDHLRLLRGVRFAARFGFAIEPTTSTAMRDHAVKLDLIARERIGGEVRRMLEHPTRAAAVSLLSQHDLDVPTLHDSSLSGVDRHLTTALAALEAVVEGDLARFGLLDRNVPVGAALAAWALDRHGEVALESPERVAEVWREALLLSNREVSDLAAALGGVRLMRTWGDLNLAGRKRAVARAMAPWSQVLVAVDSPRIGDAIAGWRAATDPASIAPPPILTGDDLIRAGFAPGPEFRTWLDAAYDAQLEGRIRSLDEALLLIGPPSRNTSRPS